MWFSQDDYSELLGFYLGDGSISAHPRTERLRIVLDVRYPLIIQECRALLARCLPQNSIDVVPSPGCVHVSAYSTHWSCLFPQHGPGPKHRRRIALEPWQREVLESAPWPFIRGCIRSDGCCFVNRTGPYEYLSYDFSNMSGDIVGLFMDACDLVGVHYRTANGNKRGLWDVRINRRASVAAMLEQVGRKT